MVPESYVWQSPYVNPLANLIEEQDKLVSQGLVRRFNNGSNEASTKTFTSLEALTLSLIPPSTEDFFTKFIKIFIKTIQAQAQALAESQNQLFKAQTPETYWDKSHIECYHFC